jgi:hypothetical protein
MVKIKLLFIIGFLVCIINTQAQLSKEELVKKFDSYQSVWTKQKLHLVLNQTKFSPGDTVWFKAYLLGEDQKKIAGRQLVNLHLVDSSEVERIHVLFNVKDGIGYNQFVIPDSLSAGIYLVTAHTNWIRNFGDEFIFKEKISIVASNSILEEKDPIYAVKAEGGHLINHVTNRVIFRTSQAGSSIKIVDNQNQEVGNTQSNQYGIAGFEFIPHAGVSYFAHLINDDKKISLPPIEEDGCSVRLQYIMGNKNPTLKIEVPSSSKYQDELYVFILSEGKIHNSFTATIGAENSGSVQIPVDKLPKGIAHVSVLARNGNLLASRDFYCSSEDQILETVSLSKSSYHTREKVNAQVLLRDQTGNPLVGEFSVRVLNGELFENLAEHSYPDEMSDDFFNFENSTFNRTDSSWLVGVNDWLITTTKSVPWKEIISSTGAKPRYPQTGTVEKNGLAYLGNTAEVVPDETQIMFYLQRNIIPHQTFIMQGKVGLVIPEMYGDDEFFYLARTPAGKEILNIRMDWEGDQIRLPGAPVWKESQSMDSYAEFTSKRKIIDQSFNVYSPKLSEEIKSSAFESELASADVVVMVQDYLIFPTVAEMIREIIPPLYHRKTRKGDIVRVGLLPPMIETNDPLYIIDGMATKSTGFFLSLNPANIISIKVINDPKKLLPLGLLGRNGIVLVETKTGDAREPLDDPAKKIIGLNRALPFKMPWQTSEILYTPFFRSTIYWNPTINTDSNGKATFEFNCTDDMGQMVILIDGMANGKPFSIVKNFEVIR